VRSVRNKAGLWSVSRPTQAVFGIEPCFSSTFSLHLRGEEGLGVSVGAHTTKARPLSLTMSSYTATTTTWAKHTFCPCRPQSRHISVARCIRCFYNLVLSLWGLGVNSWCSCRLGVYISWRNKSKRNTAAGGCPGTLFHPLPLLFGVTTSYVAGGMLRFAFAAL
jgi:hypothetical protein